MNLVWTPREGVWYLVDTDRRFDRTLGSIKRIIDWGARPADGCLKAEFTYRVNTRIPPKRFSPNDIDEAKRWLEVVATMAMS